MSMPLLLVADDVPDNRVILATLLEFHGYVVQQAQNGSEAVLLAARTHPALILMDIEMPVIDGWEAARLLKQDAETAAIPIVAVTAADLREDFHRLNAGGFCGYLQKPVAPRRILEVVRLCLIAGEEGRQWIDLSHVGIGVRQPQNWSLFRVRAPGAFASMKGPRPGGVDAGSRCPGRRTGDTTP